MATIFSRIIAGEIPCYKVEENSEFLAFLDISPLSLGHTLVIPKLEVDYIFDLEDQLLGRMMIFAKEIAKKLKANLDCQRIGVAVIGLEVPHAHIHLIPINQVSDMDFSRPKMQPSTEEMKTLSQRLNQG